MQRIHIGLTVQDLDQSVAYYSALFGEGPVVREPDYAKWTPAEPAVNLSVTSRSGSHAVHLGIDVTEKSELERINSRLDQGGVETVDEGETVCCYHRSTKTWAQDPDGMAWEVFLTAGREAEFGKSAVQRNDSAAASVACCDDGCCDGEEK